MISRLQAPDMGWAQTVLGGRCTVAVAKRYMCSADTGVWLMRGWAWATRWPRSAGTFSLAIDLVSGCSGSTLASWSSTCHMNDTAPWCTRGGVTSGTLAAPHCFVVPHRRASAARECSAATANTNRPCPETNRMNSLNLAQMLAVM